MSSMSKFTMRSSRVSPTAPARLSWRGQSSPLEASCACVRSFVLMTRNSRVSLDKKLTPPDGSEP
ncbi:hypothetical protein FIBSPDRAFT_858691 [Athelia psychrophila]|uniref:Uncharacterized protein n=1 Tax=Athelia psychrophila TaxID=1759441 RepID=A0A166LNV1_9AGAM|nr:hypothetical protein FIBSPDRAFT_858691 [Fibularhizoctonia sp. CBS 109695]